MSLISLLGLLALITTVTAATGRTPLWVPVLLLCVCLLLQVWR